jgi:hypothetical protein
MRRTIPDHTIAGGRAGATASTAFHHLVAVVAYRFRMRLTFSGEVWFWRGPSPYHFVTVPEDESAEIGLQSASVTYGWGMVPVRASIGRTEWKTSLFPKNGGYLVPLKDAVRLAEDIDMGDKVTVTLTIDVS